MEMMTDWTQAVVLVDTNPLVHVGLAKAPPYAVPGLENAAADWVMDWFARFAMDFRPGSLLAVFDPPGKTWRHKLLPSYKAHRAPKRPEFGQQLDRVKERLLVAGIPQYECAGHEADDVIATLTAQATQAGKRVLIVSRDKDLHQLVRNNVWCLAADELRGPAEVTEKYGVPAERLGDWLALAGDSSDGITGVPGIGPKTATALLKEYGSLGEILANAENVSPKLKGKKLRAGLAAASLAKCLVTLNRDVPVTLPT